MNNFLNFNPYLEKKDSKVYIFDKFRKKKVIFSPEEWVRQFILEYITQELSFSKNLIKVEKKCNSKTKIRYDLSLFDKFGNNILILECKAPHIKIDEKTINQVLSYQYFTKSKFIGVTNGISIIIWNSQNKFSSLEEIINL
jgi:hypothetical protein